jgi:hypothetical protein
MSRGFDVFAQHPLCICGPVGFGGEIKGVVTIEGCRTHACDTYGIDPHPVMNAKDVEALISAFRERMAGARNAEAEPADA